MRLIWKIYIFLYALYVLLSVTYSLAPDSPLLFYHKVTIHMNKIYLFAYLNHFLYLFMEIAGLLPLFLFAFKKCWFSSIVWKGFFALKVINVIANNYFEFGYYSNLMVINAKGTLIYILVMLAMIMPAYIALFMYAFQREKLFPYEESI